jgi:hypothetical protein
MPGISAREWKSKTEVALHGDFYKNLDASSSELRRLAQDMSDFLTPFKGKNPEIDQLADAFQDIITIKITELDIGVNAVKATLLKMDSNTIKQHKLPFSPEELKTFIEKQNNFDKTLVQLFEHAIEIDESYQS